ncbi:CRE-CCDC-55 protein [Caenorhabditis remanei]|uniref:CRE-CCDC-55 protein n=1 Tax=Caenorhabditis remanei TaxID=31234 RepID=E3MWJ3_CAERE|nr:CRE-CCDC-55 protein [Caenorhabditis remanei]
MDSKRTLGLNIKQKEEPKRVAIKVASVFGDDDDDDMPATATNAASASVIRVQKQAEREHQKAEAEDPTIFDYDGNYDEIQAIKNEKKEEARKADKKRESKYAESIIKAHARRQLETFSREERQQIKEREKEGDEFADKEVFVTGAYRKQQEEVKKYREQEAEEAAFNDMTSVQKQKMWEMGMGRTLLNDLARDPTAIKQRKKEQKNVRKREDSGDEEEKELGEDKKKPEKSIYDSDSEEEKPKIEAPPQKNFEGELKPGLNKVTKKATTRAERVQRNFTPTPPSSDDEGAPRPAPRALGDHRSSRRSGSGSPRRSRDSGRRGSEVEKTEEPVKAPKISLKEKLKPKKIDKVARLEGLKEILKQRNTENDIEEARQRYFERREQGIVVPPL